MYTNIINPRGQNENMTFKFNGQGHTAVWILEPCVQDTSPLCSGEYSEA